MPWSPPRPASSSRTGWTWTGCSPTPTSTIQWLRGTTAISGATGTSYTSTSADAGQSITARVTWANGVTPNAVATSNAVAIQTAPVAPVFTTQPALLGTPALGSTITVSLGAATGTLTGTLNRPGKAAAAVQDRDTFVIDAADQGGTITLDVTATNEIGRAHV